MEKDTITIFREWGKKIPPRESRIKKYFPSHFWSYLFSPVFLLILFYALIFIWLSRPSNEESRAIEINVPSEVIMNREAEDASIDKYYQDFVR
ncbi:MAG: hypothetical protein PHT51_01650 [Patescibacteria group bacterium]|nr:hypothetical protein [Patescibacteria group bacterium]MDD4610874.1 hypothetical protein [Patescibacteria group bacterium]